MDAARNGNGFMQTANGMAGLELIRAPGRLCSVCCLSVSYVELSQSDSFDETGNGVAIPWKTPFINL
jgi:hypothetical protein